MGQNLVLVGFIVGLASGVFYYCIDDTMTEALIEGNLKSSFFLWKIQPLFSTEKGHSSPALVIVNIPAAEKKFAIGCHDGSIRQAKLDLSGETPLLSLGDVILEQSENTKS